MRNNKASLLSSFAKELKQNKQGYRLYAKVISYMQICRLLVLLMASGTVNTVRIHLSCGQVFTFQETMGTSVQNNALLNRQQKVR